MRKMHKTSMDVTSVLLPDKKRDLTSELWSDILSRLPVKDLLKIRCICKFWCSIIDSIYFMSLNLRNYPKNNDQKLLVIEKILDINGELEFKVTVRSNQNFGKISQAFKLFDPLNILANCKDLMLITKSSLYSGSENMLWLWNPSIRKTLQVPWCPLRRKNKDDFMKFLLGFSPSEDDFKLVAFRFNKGRAKDVSIAVYSLRNHGWKSEIKRLSLMFFCFSKHHVRPHIVFFGGAAYWIGHGNDSFSIYFAKHLISFNFDSENFSFVELPDGKDDRGKRRFIFLLGESVAVLSVSSESSCIWVLGKDGGFCKEPWRKWPSTQSNLINCDLLKGCSSYLAPRLIYDQKSDNFLLHTNNKVISYNITTHQFQNLVESSCVGNLLVEPYVESLILHKGTRAQTLTSFP